MPPPSTRVGASNRSRPARTTRHTASAPRRTGAIPSRSRDAPVWLRNTGRCRLRRCTRLRSGAGVSNDPRQARTIRYTARSLASSATGPHAPSPTSCAGTSDHRGHRRGSAGRNRPGIGFHRARAGPARRDEARLNPPHDPARDPGDRAAALRPAPQALIRKAQAEKRPNVRQIAAVLRRAGGHRATRRIADIITTGAAPTYSGDEDVVLDLILDAGLAHPLVNEPLRITSSRYTGLSAGPRNGSSSRSTASTTRTRSRRPSTPTA